MIEPVVASQFSNTFAAAAAGSWGSFLLLAALGSSGETCFSAVDSCSRPELSCLLTQATGDVAFRETGVILPIIVFLTDKWDVPLAWILTFSPNKDATAWPQPQMAHGALSFSELLYRSKHTFCGVYLDSKECWISFITYLHLQWV